MLNFKTPELEDKNWISECYSYAHSMNCEYTFGNIYLWRAAYKSLVAHYDGFVICRWGSNHDIKYSLPIGRGDFRQAVQAIISDAVSAGVTPRIYGVTESYKAVLDSDFPGRFSYEYDDGNNDYIYHVEDLASLSGKKYHSKRNHISNFIKNHPDWSYEDITAQNISECIDLHTNWIENRNDSESDTDYSLEFEAVLSGFESYAEIGFQGGLIRVNHKPIAYTYGERLNEHCFVTHFEKAPADMQGAYAIVNREFAKRLKDSGFVYVNREEDLGLPGLRKAKQSYKPAIWLKKETAVYHG